MNKTVVHQRPPHGEAMERAIRVVEEEHKQEAEPNIVHTTEEIVEQPLHQKVVIPKLVMVPTTVKLEEIPL